MTERSGPLAGVAVLALAATLAGAACGGDDGGGGGGSESAAEDIDRSLIGQVQTFDVAGFDGCAPEGDRLVCTHTDEPVDYPQTPPVGGMHTPVWQNCLFYDAPIYSEGAVHAMEHGAVWITYRPDLPDDQVDLIRQMAEQPKVLASPWGDGDLPTEVVLSAWGRQLWLESLPDPAADSFLADLQDASSAPESGGPCQGGFTGTR